MIQLKFNDSFNSIIDDIILLTSDTIPSFLHDFIDKKNSEKIIYDRKHRKYYCVNCYSELKKCYCEKCYKKYSYEYYNMINIENIDDTYTDESYFHYYYFDIKSKEPILYKIMETNYLYRTTHLTLIRKLDIDGIYLIKKDYMQDMITKKIYNYKGCRNELIQSPIFNEETGEIDDSNINDDLVEYFCDGIGFLYTDNIKQLKNTVYKYTNFWEGEEYFKNHEIDLSYLTILPLSNPYFEFLMKHKLYNLAFDAERIAFNKDEKEAIRVAKKYIDFIVENDITYNELEALIYTNKPDINLLKKLADNYFALEDIYEYNVNILKVIDYFDKQGYSYDKLFEYSDYLRISKKLGFNLKDRKVLYPKDLIEEHNLVTSKYEIIKDKTIEDKINKISGLLNVNKYEDDDYVIYPAPTLHSMIEEGSMQNNCMRTYCDTYANGKTNIYFMRRKSNLKKSLVSIEVKNNKVVQARIKNNELPDDTLMNIIHKWERSLIPIDFN